jgi:trehalose synthase
MNRVTTDKVKLGAYAGIVSEQLLTEISLAAEGLKGLRVVHVSAAAPERKAAEILESLVPLMCDAGIDASWYMLAPDESFYCVCKMLQRYLQGKHAMPNASDINLYLANNEKAANTLSAMGVSADIWLFHNFQVLPMLSYMGPYNGIWICHDGIAGLNAAVRETLFPHMMNSRIVISSLAEYFPNGHSPCEVVVVPPAIDPRLSRYQAITVDGAREILAEFGIEPDQPIAGHVMCFDDPAELRSVIDAFRMAKSEVPGLQLAVAEVPGTRDGNECREVMTDLEYYIDGNPDIHVMRDLPGTGEREINALQSGASIIIQQPAGGGFDFRVTEAMWKERPVIGGNHGGIRPQIRDGLTGFVVSNAPTCAGRMVTLLRDPTLASLMGSAARESVRRKYLMPRLLRDYLQIFARLVNRRKRVFVPLGTATNIRASAS